MLGVAYTMSDHFKIANLQKKNINCLCRLCMINHLQLRIACSSYMSGVRVSILLQKVNISGHIVNDHFTNHLFK